MPQSDSAKSTPSPLTHYAPDENYVTPEGLAQGRDVLIDKLDAKRRARRDRRSGGPTGGMAQRGPTPALYDRPVMLTFLIIALALFGGAVGITMVLYL